MAKTKVVQYKARPQICKKCQMFYHSEKNCSGEITCGRCSEKGHRTNECNETPMKCPHCAGDHSAGNKQCPEYKIQEEILAIQSAERVSKQQAFIILKRNNPNFRMNYAKAIKTNPITAHETPIETTTTETPVRKTLNIVCQSPTGRLYPKQIEDPYQVKPIDKTSENSPTVRREAIDIYNEYNDDDDVKTTTKS